VAEYTRRPLLSITAADLGHDTDLLENNLLRFFRNADKWDAIVLLDEADIYLERRSTNELRRNSIVSSKYRGHISQLFKTSLTSLTSLLTPTRLLQRHSLSDYEPRWFFRRSLHVAYSHFDRIRVP
jgi:hypothetical protein